MFMQLLHQVTFITVHCVRERKAVWVNCLEDDLLFHLVCGFWCFTLYYLSFSMHASWNPDLLPNKQQEINAPVCIQIFLTMSSKNYCIQIFLTLSSKKLLVLPALRYSLQQAARNYWYSLHSDILYNQQQDITNPVCIQIFLTMSNKKLLILSAFRYSYITILSAFRCCQLKHLYT